LGGDGRRHEDLGADKNAFFDAMTVGAEQALGRPADVAIATQARAQVADFSPPPRVVGTQNGRQCSSDALDVSDREVVYFQWHSNPWDGDADANPRQTYPGHDFLVAYWLTRLHGVVSDERPEVCLQR